MKKLLFLLCLFFPVDALAQYEPPSTRLSPYEQQRYGDSLWEVPREPYQSRYQTDRFSSKVYNMPDSVVRERFQTRMQWESEQHRISERANRIFIPPKMENAPAQ
ncbi:hypothetical protein C4J81_09940 [Deltaproteobacteria bacterium Smac51]|nr:hypothetical protein C4J81_09940 [Deltaproteobacteria bacterium Smac51]